MTQQRSGAKGSRMYALPADMNGELDSGLMSLCEDAKKAPHETEPVAVFSLSPEAHEARRDGVARKLHALVLLGLNNKERSENPFDRKDRIGAIIRSQRFQDADVILSGLNLAPKGARKQAR